MTTRSSSTPQSRPASPAPSRTGWDNTPSGIVTKALLTERPAHVHADRFVALLLGILIWSGSDPFDRMTCAREVFPTVIALGRMVATHRRFPPTALAARR